MFLQGKAKAKQALVADEEDDHDASVRKTPFFACHFVLKTIILPRQTLDKHTYIGNAEMKRGVSFAAGGSERCPGKSVAKTTSDGTKGEKTVFLSHYT